MRIHKVSIRHLSSPVPVFDITVPLTGNFKSGAGVILKQCDADPDGLHISTLILTFIHLYMRPMIRAKKIFVIRSPLFIGSYKEKRWFADSLDELKIKAGRYAENMRVSRLKGHGESRMEDLKRYAMDKNTRKLWRVGLAKGDGKIMLSLMGSDSAFRKEILGVEV